MICLTMALNLIISYPNNGRTVASLCFPFAAFLLTPFSFPPGISPFRYLLGFDVQPALGAAAGDVEEGEDLEPCGAAHRAVKIDGGPFSRGEKPVYVPVEALAESVPAFTLQPLREVELLADLAVTIFVSDLQVSDCPLFWGHSRGGKLRLFQFFASLPFRQG